MARGLTFTLCCSLWVVPLMPGCWPLSSHLISFHPGLGPPAHLTSGLLRAVTTPSASPPHTASPGLSSKTLPGTGEEGVHVCGFTMVPFLEQVPFLIQEVSAPCPSVSLRLGPACLRKLQLVWEIGRQADRPTEGGKERKAPRKKDMKIPCVRKTVKSR